jgi:two-component system sensor histidine kinase BaeS
VSLVGRLLATSVLVALCATVATAWLAVQSTTRAIRHEQGQSLAADQGVYELLLGYAATHRDWAGVGAVVDRRSAEIGYRITLMTGNRQVIADSASGPSLRAARPSATVDPLRTDRGARIDPRAVGPYRLTAAEHRGLEQAAARQAACAGKRGVPTRIAETVSGRPAVVATGPDLEEALLECQQSALLRPTRTEAPLLTALRDLTAKCLDLPDRTAVVITPGFTLMPSTGFGPELSAAIGDNATVAACIKRARQSQLRAYVAPPALLFVTDLDAGAGRPVLDLSRGNTIRIAGVTAAVLALAILATVLVGRRLVGPLRALTEMARRPVGLQSRVAVATDDEIGVLATAFNDLSERRDEAERRRTALVSDVARELRAPVATIRDRLAQAQDGRPLDAPEELLELLLTEAAQVQHIIDDLRDLAAAEAGTLRLHPEPIYFADVLDRVTGARRETAQTAAVDLSCEIHGHPEITADPVRLEQLLDNVVAAAIRSTPRAGAVLIGVREEGPALTVTISHGGTAISLTDLAVVISRQLARAHGGELTVEGTVCTVRLPSA